ncbi:MAG: hypothetical protein MZV63_17385 [Marinilabiliales bacterium]|nr:hypothetical protein [Marinilabiliales bacterium]
MRRDWYPLHEDVRAGDEVFILTPDGTCIGVGRAKVDAAVAREMKKGQIVRTRRNIASTVCPGEASWADAVQANTEVLRRAESSSILFVQEVAGRNTGIWWQTSHTPGEKTALPPCWW